MTADLTPVRAQVELLQYCRNERAKLAARIDELEACAKAAIQEAMGDQEIGVLDGVPLITWKTTKRTSLDQKLLKALHPDVFEECKSTTEVRRFEVK
ncbi:hypothetical protein LT350_33705 [Mycolicibacterium smegmatis]|uniref:hypothetical protein n=1 Tax=Mycolicibacterium smegmatis TaxID=1772 RepID=UPI001E446BC9|nr:hypothetical protein [Mycolicibacterium smegmatis]UGU31379.1 hypothetical protein LT350_33705 [Mycolicibacterium smegmatis]ULN72275.1 hypothetical protein KZ782_10450 [Mycolicibacterium smegmatis]